MNGLIDSCENQRPEVAMIVQMLLLKVSTVFYQNYWTVGVALPYPTHHMFSEGDYTSTGQKQRNAFNVLVALRL